MTMIRPDLGRSAVSNSRLALIVYVLYFVAYFTGITGVIGVIIAHVKVNDPDPMVASHYRFQIRTFWISIVCLIVGTVLTYVLVGFLVLAWWFTWSMIRNIKGILALNEKRPIANPASWMFG